IVTCEANSTWTPPLLLLLLETLWTLFCSYLCLCLQLLGYCGPPPNFAFAELTGAVSSQSLAGTELTYKCKAGYTAASGKSSVVTCLMSTTWFADSEFCIRGCGAPTRLLFAELSEEYKNEIDFPVGKTVTYTCRPGYAKHPGMSPTITCLDSGVWSEALEFCKTLACPPPPDIANGKHGGQPGEAFSPGASVNYHCDPGYALVGEARLNCTASGAWSLPVPRCEGPYAFPVLLPCTNLWTLLSLNSLGASLEAHGTLLSPSVKRVSENEAVAAGFS
uniref:Sushi domain-containing protein n=1 Tax=Dromaius novaehollandiae TaxID=8790 RepID=A0A8C4K9W8_DRONO